MDENLINKLLDVLVVKTQNQQLFSPLSQAQKAIAATELLIGTTTRSGVSNFFIPENSHVFKDAEQGLRLIGVPEMAALYLACMNSYNNGNIDRELLKQLQANIINKYFEEIYQSVRKYVEQNYDQLSKNII